MLVQFRLTRAEYLEGAHQALRRLWLLWLIPIMGVVALIFGAAVNPPLIVPGLVLLGSFGWTWWIAPRRRWARDPAQAGPFTYRFDDDGIEITSPAADVRLPWDRVRRVMRGRRLLVIAVDRTGVLVPYRAVDDRSALDALVTTKAAGSGAA